MTTSRRSFLALVAGSALTALSGYSALSTLGETPATPVLDPGPAVSASSIGVGPLMGGTPVTLTGYDLTDVVGVTLDTMTAPDVSVDAAGTLTFTTPAALDYQPANASIVLVSADGSELDTGRQFSYRAMTAIDHQMQYAFTYWLNYNLRDWGRFEGNDCGNFVNQTLVARGWAENPAWYSNYASTGAYSLSWIRGNEMDAFLASRPETTRLEVADRSAVKVGDVVMFDFDPQNGNGVDHTMLVSRVDAATASGDTAGTASTNSIKLVGHTDDAQYRDFDTVMTVEYPGSAAHFYSIA